MEECYKYLLWLEYVQFGDRWAWAVMAMFSTSGHGQKKCALHIFKDSYPPSLREVEIVAAWWFDPKVDQ